MPIFPFPGFGGAVLSGLKSKEIVYGTQVEYVPPMNVSPHCTVTKGTLLNGPVARESWALVDVAGGAGAGAGGISLGRGAGAAGGTGLTGGTIGAGAATGAGGTGTARLGSTGALAGGLTDGGMAGGGFTGGGIAGTSGTGFATEMVVVATVGS